MKTKLKQTTTNQSGFTLIEILVVIGIIAVLAAIVLVAINPARQFAQARNTERQSNVTAIIDAIGQYIADHEGSAPSGITEGNPAEDGDWKKISNTGADICGDLIPNYLSALPTEPSLKTDDIESCDGDYNAGYEVIQDEVTKRFSVRVNPSAQELDVDISITR